MLCVNLEGASLKGCNFEDPAGSRANMEGNDGLCTSHLYPRPPPPTGMGGDSDFSLFRALV